MSKDPNFPFYTQDFMIGTLFFSDEEVGVYLRLLCIQHQHGGLISKSVFNSKTEKYPNVRQKFVETEDGFFNQRLMREMVKRQKKSSNLSANALKRWEIEKQKQCNCIANVKPHENENENINKKGGVGENRMDLFAQFMSVAQVESKAFNQSWENWIDQHIEKNDALTPKQAKAQLEMLAGINLKDAIAMLNYSFRQGYKGLVQPKENDIGSEGFLKLLPSEREPYIAKTFGKDSWRTQAEFRDSLVLVKIESQKYWVKKDDQQKYNLTLWENK